MQVLAQKGALSPVQRARPCVVAIGNFDGVHLGHAKLLQTARDIAQKNGVAAAALTFEPHPARVLAPSLAPPLICTLERRLQLIAALGIDTTIVQTFDADFAALSPEAFARHLRDNIGAEHVCVGYDFSFGKKRAGTTALLTAFGTQLGFGVTIVDAVAVDGLVCSSTKVREFVLAGRLDGARLILGRDPEIAGVVVRGAGRGRTIGIPTANVQPSTELLPASGVYAGYTEIENKKIRAAINIGKNPTFGQNALTVEAHLLDFTGDLYGQPLRLQLVTQLRAERRFAGVDELVAQIHKDIEETRGAIK